MLSRLKALFGRDPAYNKAIGAGNSAAHGYTAGLVGGADCDKKSDLPRKSVQITVQDIKVDFYVHGGMQTAHFVTDAIPAPYHDEGFYLQTAEAKLLSFTEEWKRCGAQVFKNRLVKWEEFLGGEVVYVNRKATVEAYDVQKIKAGVAEQANILNAAAVQKQQRQ